MADTTVVGSIAVKVSPDTDDFRNQLRRLLQRMEREVTGIVHVAADLDTARLRADFSAMMTRLRVDARRGINIRARVDDRQLGTIGTLLGGVGQSTAKALSGALTRVVDGAASASSNLLLVAAAATLVPPALALVSGALVGLPALLAAVVVPAGAIALGMDGMKQAAKRLQPQFDSLKDTMNAITESSFGAVFERIKPIFGSLQRTLPKVTEGLATMAQGFVDAVSSPSGMSAIENTITNIGKSLATAAPGVRDFTDGLLNLASKVSNRLPGLANMFNNFSSKFATWVDKITTVDSSGTSPLDRAMTGLRDTLQSVLDLTKDLATQGFDFLANGNAGQKVKDIVESFNKLLTETLPDLQKAFDKIAVSVKGIADNWNKIEWGLNPLGKFAENQPAVPGIPKIDAGSSGIDVFISDLKIAEMLWLGLKPKLINGFREVTIGLSTMLSDIGNGLTNAANTIASGASKAWQDIVTGAQNVGPQLSGAWSGLGIIATTAWDTVVSAATNAITQTVSAVATGAGQIVAELATWPGKFIAALGDVGSLLVDSGKALIQGFITGITSMAGAAADAASGLLSKVRSFFPFSPAKQGPFSGSGWVDSSGESIGKAFGDGLQSTQAKIVEIARALMQAIKDVFGDAHGLALNFNFGGNNAFGALQDSLAGVSGAAKDMSRSFASSTNPTRKLDDESRQMLQQLDLQKDQLELERKKLDVSKSMAGSKAEKQVIQDQIDQLNLQKKQLAVQMDQVKLGGKYENSVTAVADGYNDQFKNLQQIPTDLMKANVDQGLSDLGIGGGAITGGAAAAIGWGQEALGNVFNFNVSNIDEAMAVKQRQTNLDALGIQGR